MMKRNKLLALLLALVLCVSLPIPALAAEGTTKVIVNGCFQITMDGFLRTETLRFRTQQYDDQGEICLAIEELALYVVADNSAVMVEAAPGYRYAKDYFDREPGAVRYVPQGCEWIEMTHRLSAGGVGHIEPLTGPFTLAITPSTFDSVPIFGGSFGVDVVCESDLARMTANPDHLDWGEPMSDAWAHFSMAQSCDLGLFPDGVDPYQDDCRREMTGQEFTQAAVKLYERLGSTTDEPSLSEGLLPSDGSIDREQAAVLLARVYTQLGTDIPPAEATLFDDDDQISDWAKAAVDFLNYPGIIQGVGSWAFAPQRPLTVQEGMTLIQRALDDICVRRLYAIDTM